MKGKQNIFFSFECLTERSQKLKAFEIQKQWFSSNVPTAAIFQKFLDINSRKLAYLNITAFLDGSDRDLHLYFRSERFIGAVPLISPITSKPFADLLVYPRFTSTNDKFTYYTQLINLIGKDIEPEFDENVDLKSSLNFRPPLYHQSLKYLQALFALSKKPWYKFVENDYISYEFKGNVRWDKVANRNEVVDVSIPTSYSTLTNKHHEYAQLKFAFTLAKEELLSNRTPIKIRNKAATLISLLDKKLNAIQPSKTKEIGINRADFALVRHTKQQANHLLRNDATFNKAWRIDYSIVFERTVQYIFELAAKETGAVIYKNCQFKNAVLNNHAWELTCLEPDIVLIKDKSVFFVDAKYKSHLFNRYVQSDFLKQEFRNDLHQVLAYASFDTSSDKLAFLCYPNNNPTVSVSFFFNHFNNTNNKIVILGVPLELHAFLQVKEKIKDIIVEHSR